MGFNSEMDKYEHRRMRLLTARDRYCDGSIATLANRIGRSASYVARMLYPEGKAGKKRIAEDMVDVIEAAFPFARGWMDSTVSFTLLESPDGTARDVSHRTLTDRAATARPSKVSIAAESLIAAVLEADKRGLSAEAFNALKEMLRLLGKGAHPQDTEPFDVEDPSQ